jgi:two-component system, OmpR family, KDP operon response regulator KdpE
MIVVAVDDDPRARDFVKRALQPQQYIVESFENAYDAMNYIRDHHVDVVLLDNKLRHGPDGLTLAKEVRAMRPECVIIMLSAYTESKYILEALRAHVDDFLIKDQTDPVKLIQSMGEGILKRRRYFPSLQSPMRCIGALEIDLVGENVTWHGKPLHLTDMEFKIVIHLTSKPGQVFGFAELYFLCTGEHLKPSAARTKIKGHIFNLRQKLEQGGRYPQTVISVYGKGFKWEDSEQASTDEAIEGENTEGEHI